jgi:hypothetical protein
MREGEDIMHPGIFCIMDVCENMMGPCWDVCGVIDLEQLVSLEEHLAAIVIIVCYY